jgi:hypothetical protein
LLWHTRQNARPEVEKRLPDGSQQAPAKELAALRELPHEAILDEILEERVVSSRKRINPRGVKRKMSNYPLRPRKRQPTRHVAFAKRIRIIK